MPANNEFEKKVQQQLDDFQLTPQPADWQAVYERLHPTRRRRIIWWWLPLAAGLIGLGIWLSKEPAGNSRSLELNQETVATKNSDDNNPASSASHHASAVQHPQKGAEKEAGFENAESAFGGSKAKVSTQELNNPAGANTGTRPEKVEAVSIQPIAAKRVNTKSLSTVEPAVISEEKQVTASVAAAPVLQSGTGDTIAVKQSHPKVVDAAAAQADDTSSKKTTLAIAATTTDTLVASTRKSSENARAKSKQWQWKLYAGLGYNSMQAPFSSSKAMADYAVNAPGSSVIISTRESMHSGMHGAVGAAVEKSWNNNWKLSLGLGLNKSTWSTDAYTYRDSFVTVSSVFLSRTVVQLQERSYSSWMLELPMTISGRIFGKKQESLWWLAGMNQQFLLSLKSAQTTQSVAQNFSSVNDTESLNGQANSYQPQLRFGLAFLHAGARQCWQLQPLVNYSLSPLFKAGLPNDHMLNLQLQFQYYLRSKKAK